ncbi:MAG TPA: phosphatidylserine/phosphatidylglycerophosphate/cardiolipin synthase family protein [Vicinamibacterales bacterium]|nr:phosphatidylserine/phosphatidylglycerophosphate/cardiolipin synthase family protein [Vicinamibacterales bacterium]
MRSHHVSGSAVGVVAGSHVAVTLLRDTAHGGDPSQPRAVAQQLTEFVAAAKTSVHIAIYDFRLSAALGKSFIDALIERAASGLDVKIAYDHTKPNTKTTDAFIAMGGDPAPKGTHVAMKKHFAKTPVQTKAILTIPDAIADKEVGTEPIEGSHLMHSKYIIRDAHTADAAVLTGSANFTDDAWTHQENNVLEIRSPELAQYYETDFQELWATGNIKSTGVNDLGSVWAGSSEIDVAFAPGEGPTIDSHVAALISAARRRVKIASMVITSQQILGALNDVLQNDRVPIDGIYDGSEMDHTVATWKKSGSPQLPLFDALAKHLVKKHSNVYSPTATHNFMHDKIVVCDDAIATGSFNLSKNATMNAENSLIIHDTALADDYAAYIDQITAAYRK